jgi:hypothetical protein
MQSDVLVAPDFRFMMSFISSQLIFRVSFVAVILSQVCFSAMMLDSYTMSSLCLAWVGGPGTVIVSLSEEHLKPSWFQMTCCLPAILLDGFVIPF